MTTQPLAGVCVYVYGVASGQACSGADGMFRIGGLPSGGYFLSASDLLTESHLGGRPVAVVIDSSGIADIGTISLSRSSAITGRIVRDSDGSPVGGACVNVVDATTGFDVASDCTDADGTYRAWGFDGGDYVVRVVAPIGSGLLTEYHHDKTSGSTADRLTVAPAAVLDHVDEGLASGGSISGRVTDAGGVPVMHVCVEASTSSTSLSFDSAGGAGRGCTGTDGRYTVTGLVTGSYTVKFMPPWGSNLLTEWFDDSTTATNVTKVAVTAGSDTPRVDASLRTGGSITGRVTGPTGAGVGNATVEVHKDGAVTSEQTNVDGTYTVGALTSGSYTVFVRRPVGANLLDEWFDGASDPADATSVTVTTGVATPDIDVSLAAGASISGRVTGPTGAGVAGVSVTASIPGTGLSMGNEVAASSSITAVDGSYSIVGLRTGEFTVKFTPPYGSDLVPEWYDNQTSATSATKVALEAGKSRDSVNATLGIGGVITGRVTDAVGDPIPGITVRAVESNMGLIYTAVSLVDGTYAVRGLPSGSYRVSFGAGGGFLGEWWNDAPDQSSATLIDVTAGASVAGKDAVLAASSSITGRVTDSAGNPVAGLAVAAYQGAVVPATATTLSNGTYTLTGLAPGSYQLRFGASSSGTSDFLSEWWDNQPSQSAATVISVGPSEHVTGKDAVLQRGASIAGRISALDGSPIGNVTVSLYQGVLPIATAYTRPDGSYVVRGLATGTYQLRFSDYSGKYVGEWFDDQPTQATATTISVNAEEVVTGKDAILAASGHVSGVVTDINGQSVGGVWVQAFLDGETSPQTSVLTAADGSYRLGGLRQGSYRLQFVTTNATKNVLGEYYDDRLDLASATPVAVAAGQEVTGCNAVLAAGGSITGTVRGPNGMPVSWATLSAYRNGEFVANAWTGVDGAFRIDHLVTGSYLLQINGGSGSGLVSQWWNGRDKNDADPISVTAGQTTTGVDVSLTAGASISGTVTGHDGVAIAATAVSVYRDGQFATSTTTTANGTYTISELAPGRYTISFSPPPGSGYMSEWFDDATSVTATPIELTAGQQRTGVDAVLTRTPAITMRVVGEDGSPLAGADVVATRSSPYQWQHAIADANGRAVITGLPAGDYHVRISEKDHLPEWYNGQANESTATVVTLTADHDTDLGDITLTTSASISGVVRDQGGAPIPNADVMLESRNGDSTTSTTSYADAQGRYRISGFGPGDYYLRARTYNGRYLQLWWDGRSTAQAADAITVAAREQRKGVDFHLPPAAWISGRVTDSAGAPIPRLRVEAFQTGTRKGYAYTSSDGSYQIGELPSGTYTVRFGASDEESPFVPEWHDGTGSQSAAKPVSVTVGRGATGVDGHLTRYGAIEGRVTDDAGVALAGIQVGNGSRSVTTDSSGRYRIGQMTTGSYAISFTDPKGDYLQEWYDDQPSKATATPVAVGTGRTVTGIDAALTRAGHVTGSVRNVSGDLLFGIHVTAWKPSTEVGSLPFTAVRDVITDANGTYDLGGLPTGTYVIGFSDSSSRYHSQWQYDVSVVAPGTVSGVDAVLVAGTIKGTITGDPDEPGGTPVPLANVRIYAYQGSEYKATSLTAADGTYELRGLASGSYRLQFRDESSTGRYATEWYDDAADFTHAGTVEFVAGVDATADARLARRGSIAGTVTDTSGAPVVGVRVDASSVNDLFVYGYGSGLTDADGHYEIAALDSTSYRVQFTDPQLRVIGEYYDDVTSSSSATLVPVVAGQRRGGVDAALARYGSISGRVLDDAGAPASGVTVTVDPLYRSATTDADGRYSVVGITTGSYRVQFADPSRRLLGEYYDNKADRSSATTVDVTTSKDTSGINATLATGGTLSGRVTDRAGAPLAGIQLTVNGLSSVTTATDGTYAVFGLATGTYRVGFSDPQGHFISQYFNDQATYAAATPIAVTAGAETQGIDASLRAYGSIVGRVTTANGSAIGSVSVAAAPTDGQCCNQSATTGTDGRYEFDRMTPGSWTVTAGGPIGSRYEQLWWNGASKASAATPIVVASGAAVTGIDLALPERAAIAGVAVDTTGAPLSDVSIEVLNATGQRITWGTSDVLGRFTVYGLESGDVKVRFSRSGYANSYYGGASVFAEASALTVTRGQLLTGIDGVLAPNGSVSGTVTGPTGAPLSGIKVTVQTTSQGKLVDVASAVTNPSGRYVVTSVPNGLYRVRFSGGASYVTEWWKDVTDPNAATGVSVAAETAATGVDASLAAVQTGAVAGRVVDGEGEPLAGVEVTAVNGLVTRTSTTTADGSYRILLAAGQYQVRFHDPWLRVADEWYLDAATQSGAQIVTVGADDTVADATLEQRLVTISGTVTSPDNSGVGGQRVELVSTANRVIQTAITDVDGRYAFVGVASGTYRVRVIDPAGLRLTTFKGGGTGTPVVVDGSTRLIDGIDVVVASRASISGTIRSPEGGPLNRIRVQALVGGVRVGDVSTDALGRYTVRPDATGSVVLFFSDGSGLGYLSEYYQDTEDLNAATPIHLDAGHDVVGIDAVMDDNHAPTATLSSDVTKGFGPLDVTLSFGGADQDGDPLEYLLEFGDGESQRGALPATSVHHTYAKAGQYPVRLQVSDGLERAVQHLSVTVRPDEPTAAKAGDDLLGVAGQTFSFNGGASTPIDLVERYSWDFGDGATATGPIVNHSFASPGNYTVKLSVTAFGTTDTDTARVEVLPTGAATGLKVQVLDGAGTPLAGSIVVVTTPTAQSVRGIANSSGTATLGGLADGDYAIAVSGPDQSYAPLTTSAAVRSGEGTATVRLQKQKWLEADLTSRPLTYGEIVARGIDVNDPANQNVLEWVVTVPGVATFPMYSNGTGGFIASHAPSGSTCVGRSCRITLKDGSICNLTKSIDDQRLIALYVPGKASWLKEFYDVTMTVYNRAAAPFTLRGGWVQLVAPEGLSLAPTAAPQSWQQPMADVPAQGQSSVSWTLRGDREGFYDLNATYTGRLEPTGLEVRETAETATPVHVWGGSAVEMAVSLDDAITQYAPYTMRVGLKNVADVPLYNVGVELAAKGVGYIHEPLSQLAKSTSTVAPGQTFWAEYRVVPWIQTGSLDLEHAVVCKCAGATGVATKVISQPAPAERPGLDVESWGTGAAVYFDPVPGAVGYDAFATTDVDTPGNGKQPDAPFGDRPLASTNDGAARLILLPVDKVPVDTWVTVSTRFADGRRAMVHGLALASKGDSTAKLLVTRSPWSGVTPYEATVSAEDRRHQPMTITDVSIKDEGPMGRSAVLTDVGGRDGVKTRFTFGVKINHPGNWRVLVTGRLADGREAKGVTSITVWPRPEDRQYWAMGDSYSSGEGNKTWGGVGQYQSGTDIKTGDEPSTAWPGNMCHRSDVAYPWVVARRNPTLPNPIHIACSGAVIANFGTARATSNPPRDFNFDADFAYLGKPTGHGDDLENPRNHQGLQYEREKKVQLDKIGTRDQPNYNVTAVSLTIGGNDVGFGKVLAGCTWSIDRSVLVFLNWMKKPPACSSAIEDRFEPALDRLETILPAYYEEVQRRAPLASIYVLGYPHLFRANPASECWLSVVPDVKMSARRMRLSNEGADRLNDVIKKAVDQAAANVHFIDVRDEFAGHGLCDDDPAINPVLMDGVHLDPGSFHPTAKGQQLYAEAFEKVLGDEPPAVQVFTGNAYTQKVSITPSTEYTKINVRWPGSTVGVQLTSPSGRVVTTSGGSPDVHVSTTPTSVSFVLDRPEPGEWTVTLTGEDVDPSGEPVTVTSTSKPVANESPAVTLTATKSGASTVVLHSDATDADGRVETYAWDWEDDGQVDLITVTPDASHVYPNGLFTPSVTVTDDDGATAIAGAGAIWIGTANAAPTAVDDSYTVSGGVPADLSITTNDSDDDTPVPDLTIALGSPPEHGYATIVGQTVRYVAQAGYIGVDNFRYMLCQVNVGCSMATVTVEVVAGTNQLPNASFSVVAIGQNARRFDATASTDADGAIASYVWNFGDGTTGTGQLVDHVYAASGSYAVTLTVTDGEGAFAQHVETVELDGPSGPQAVPDRYTVTAGNALRVDAPGVLDNDRPDRRPLEARLTGGPLHGDAMLAPDGSFTYKPDDGFIGDDSFVYVVNDGGDDSTPATVTITVRGGENTAPIALPAIVSLAEDTSRAITLEGIDADGDSLTFTLVDQPLHGTLSGTAPNLRYTPSADYHGPDSFTFRVSDGRATSSPATVLIDVTSVNDAPVAADRDVATTSGTPVEVLLFANDADGDPLTFSVATPPSHGTVTIAGAQATYTPEGGFVGQDTFTYISSDGAATSAPATVHVSVTGPNRPPVATAAHIVTDEDTAVAVSLAGIDPDGDDVSASVLTQPAHGTLSGKAPNLTYTPEADYSGVDSFTFTVADASLTSQPATISIEVRPIDDPPTAVDSSATTAEDTPIAILLAASDPDGDPLSYDVGTPDHGQLTGTAPYVTYTPDADFHGSDSFSFTVSDGRHTSRRATVTLQVDPVNDQPVATAQRVVSANGEPIAIKLDADDADGDSLTFTVVAGPAHGQLSGTAPFLTYTPDAGYRGADSFTFVASDGLAVSAPATVTIDVTRVNTVPVATPQSVVTDKGVAVAVSLAGSDADGDVLQAVVADQPGHGTLSGAAPNLTYTPDAGFTGTDTFTFTVSDGEAVSIPATVTVTVRPANGVPVAMPQSVVTSEDVAVPVQLEGTDSDNDPLTYAVVASPQHGTLSGTAPTLTYTPDPDYAGTDSLRFTVSDGRSTSDAATVSITIAAVNDPPTATPIELSVDAGKSVSISLVGTDPDHDVLSFAVATSPQHGTLAGEGSTLTYTPSVGFVGDDSFTFVASDGTVSSPPATVTIHVRSVCIPLKNLASVTGRGAVGTALIGVGLQRIWLPFGLGRLWIGSVRVDDGTGPTHFLGVVLTTKDVVKVEAGSCRTVVGSISGRDTGTWPWGRSPLTIRIVDGSGGVPDQVELRLGAKRWSGPLQGDITFG